MVNKYNSEDKNCENPLDLEKDEFGVTHQEVGRYLLSWWEFIFTIVEAVLFHHRPFNDAIVIKELVFSVHIAQKYACEIIKEKSITPFYPETFTALNIEQNKFEKSLQEILNKK